MVGAGIFSVLALTVQTTGTSAVIAWFLIVLLSFPMALTFSDLVGVLSESGGPYVYIRDRSGAWLGLWTAWLFLVSAAGATEALFIAYVQMLRELGVDHAYACGVVTLLVLALVTSLGIHVSAKLQRILTVGTVALLTLCVAIGLLHPVQLVGAHRQVHFWSHEYLFPNGWAAVFPATFYAFWTYSGWEAVAVPSGSYKSPKSLAVGMVAGSLLVGVLYIFVALAAVVSVPTASLARYTNPLVLVGRLSGPVAESVIGWGALIVVVGSMLSWFIASASLCQALIRDGLIPSTRRLRDIQAEYHPVLPLLMAGAFAVLARLPIFAKAVASSSLTALIGYAVVFLTVVRDKNTWDGLTKSRRLRTLLAALSLAMTVLLILFSGWENMWPTFVLCLLGFGLLWIRKNHL
jgi:amino acid efflux transporter